MRKSSAFTLAEVLITLAIIGVVAAMTIPGVIVRTNQQEFKTGFKKAVSVLNQAVTMNLAMDNESPEGLASQAEVIEYLQRRMNVVQSDIDVDGGNKAFYTADGMRFEFPSSCNGHCTAEDPCVFMVDVNGERGPIKKDDRTKLGAGSYPTQDSTVTIDALAVMMTDSNVAPYGGVAQRTMYQD